MADLDIKRMSLLKVSRERLSSQRLRDLFARSHELPFWGSPGQLSHILRIYFAHDDFCSIRISFVERDTSRQWQANEGRMRLRLQPRSKRRMGSR